MHVAARLRIPDLLAAGPRTAAELAAECGADGPTLQLFLRALTSLEMFALTDDGRFHNTPLTETLRSDHPQSMRDSALFLPAPFLWRPLGDLYESVRTGEAAFPRVFGQNFFDYLAVHADDAAVFNRVMAQGSTFTAQELLAAYDFSRFEQLVDVGGGHGTLLSGILAATSGLKGILFDLPSVVADATVNCRIVGGDFFTAVPEGADAYILKGILHDWRDEDAARILRNVRRAIRSGGTLLLVEGLTDSGAGPVGLMALLMLAVGGRERTESEWRALLEITGFSLTRIIRAGRTSLLECHPIPGC